MKAVDGVRQAVGKFRIGLVGPALRAHAGNRVRDRDGVIELLEHTEHHRAMRPRTVVRDIEVIAPGLGLEAGRTVGGDAVAKQAVDALERAALAELGRRIAVGPLAVQQIAHRTLLRFNNSAACRARVGRYRRGSGWSRSARSVEPRLRATCARCRIRAPPRSRRRSACRPRRRARPLRTPGASTVLASSPHGWPASNSAAAGAGHEVGRLRLGVGARDRELDALVLADRPVEHDALARRSRGARR